MPIRRPSFYTRPLSKAKSTSSVTPSSRPSPEEAKVAPSSTNYKESRSWEHHRQRSKKTAELLKAKVRKGQGVSKLHESTNALDMALNLRDSRTAEEDFEPDINDVSPVLGGAKLYPMEDILSDHRPEVQLADLLISRKPRHGKDNDFEVVPHVRSVIVLDDDVTPDLDFDEPWEHIYGVEDGPTTREPSYAKIASLN